MKNPLQAYILPFTSLKDGLHQFDYEVDNHFFSCFDYSLIDAGKVEILLELDKKSTMLVGNFSISGEIETVCDRCNDPLSLPVKGKHRLVFTFGNEDSGNESLIVLPPEAYELHLANYIYEFISLCLPLKKVHPAGKCNEEMLKIIQQHSIFRGEDEDIEEDCWEEE